MSSDINVQTFSGKVNITSNLLVGTSHLFVDTINNRVGLVTNTPDAGLHVNSNAYVHTDFRVGSGIVMNDTTGRITAGSFVGDGSAMTGINSDSGSWVNGTNSNVHLATNGDKVGIGVVEPTSKLDVDGTVTATSFSGIQESDVPTLSAYATTTAPTFTGDVTFDTDTLKIDSTNNRVGIGTDAPGEKLHIQTPTGTSECITRIASYMDDGSSRSTSGIEFYTNPEFFNGDNSIRPAGYIHSGFIGATNNWNDSYLKFKVREGSGAIVDAMTITNGGNVGIGTTNPLQKLDLGDLGGGSIRLGRDHDDDNTSTNRIGRTGVGNDVWYSSVNFIDEDTNDDAISFVTHLSGVGQFERMRISGNGNVGIGVSDPTHNLHVGAGNASLRIGATNYAGSAANTSTSGLERSRNQILFSTWRDAQTDKIGAKICGINKQTYSSPNARHLIQSTDLAFFTVAPNQASYDDTVERLRITDAGNVGIGTTSPAYKLDVSGNLRVTGGIVDTSWCSGSWLQTCTQSPTVTVYSNNGGGPMTAVGHGGTGMGGSRGRFTAKKAGNYLISCCAIHSGRGSTSASGSNLLVVFDAVGTNWNPNNVIDTYDEIIDLRGAPSVEEAYTFACQVYMNVGHYFSFRVHSSGYIDNSTKLLCSAALVR